MMSGRNQQPKLGRIGAKRGDLHSYTYHQPQCLAKRPFEFGIDCQNWSWLQNLPRNRDGRGLLAWFHYWVAASARLLVGRVKNRR